MSSVSKKASIQKNLLRNTRVFLCVERLASPRRLPDLVPILETSQSKSAEWFLFLMVLTDKDCWESLGSVHPVALTHVGDVLMFVGAILQRQAKLLETLVNVFCVNQHWWLFICWKKVVFFLLALKIFCVTLFSVLCLADVFQPTAQGTYFLVRLHIVTSVTHQLFAATQKENSSSYLTRHSM